MDVVWDHILGGHLSSQKAIELMDIFDDDDYLQTRRFTTLHKTVLVLAPELRPLETQLQGLTSSINAVDSQGRTCLSWAAERGDIDAVQTLLEFNADAAICDSQGMPPLFHAIAQDRVAAVELLLARTKTHLMVTTHGMTALQIAASSDPKILELIIKHGGINVNSVDENGRTPLHSAARWGSNEHIRLLRDAGADLDAPDKHSQRPVHWAIMHNNHATVEELSSLGARFNLFDKRYNSVLNFAARRCDPDILQIMAKASSIRELDPNDARKGCTWLAYAEYYLKAYHLMDDDQIQKRMDDLYDFQAQVWGEQEEAEEKNDDDGDGAERNQHF